MDPIKSQPECGPSGDQDRNAQFLALYTECYPRLQYFLMALLPTSHDAADVLQETSVVLWRKFDTFELGTNFYAWACKIARLQTLKHRERSNRSAKLFSAETIEILADDAIDDAVPTEHLEVLESCMQGLSDSDRQLIRRRYEPGTSVKQIASDIGMSANLLSKSLGRIRRMLLACMERKLARE